MNGITMKRSDGYGDVLDAVQWSKEKSGLSGVRALAKMVRSSRDYKTWAKEQFSAKETAKAPQS